MTPSQLAIVGSVWLFGALVLAILGLRFDSTGRNGTVAFIFASVFNLVASGFYLAGIGVA